MRRLLLLRHAKSSWDEEGLTDFDRPLAPRGREAADAIGARLAAGGIVPDHIFCSAARRARETLAGLLPHLPGEPKIRLTRRLYDEAGGDYCRLIQTIGEGATLLVIGHNPAVAATLVEFGGKGQRSLLRRLSAKYPTAGLATVEFDVENWADIVPHGGRLIAFLEPKDLRRASDDGED